MSSIELIHGDCMEYMAKMRDKEYDLAICDPPYGIGENGSRNLADRPTAKWANPNSQIYKTFDDNFIPDKQYFIELQRISINQIIWGANNFVEHLYPSTGWVVWDKVVDEKELLSMVELAYTSFPCRAKKFEFLWAGFKKAIQETRIHPTQKPVKLYEWLLKNYAKTGDKILDTHLGSGSIAIACYNLDFSLTGFEIDKDYYDGAVNRLEEHKKQGRLFG